MKTGDSIIIHSSPIVQHGLKSILLSRSIGIRLLLHTLPEMDVIIRWKDTLILADTRFGRDLCHYGKRLKRNGNILIGIESTRPTGEPDALFPEVIHLDDTMEVILRKIIGITATAPGHPSGNRLTARETVILTMVAQGFSNKLIAGKLFISIHTVITHRKNITAKLGIRSIPGLTLYAALNDLVDLQT